MLSIYMDAHFDMQIIRHIRLFSFAVLLITVFGYTYLNLFTRNLKVNYWYCVDGANASCKYRLDHHVTCVCPVRGT